MHANFSEVLYVVADLPSTIAWYGRHFGFAHRSTGDDWAELDMGGESRGATFTVIASRAWGADARPRLSVNYASLDTAVAHMLSCGATVAPIHGVAGGTRMTTVFDPDGNPIAIWEDPHVS